MKFSRALEMDLAATCKHLLRGAPDCVFCHRDQLKQELSLAEEGLANYAQEVKQLREALTKIAAYDPGKFRPLEDEIAIWRLATEGLSGHPGAEPVK